MQRPAYLPFGALGMPRRLGQRNDLSRKVALLGLREQLATPVIGQLSGLMWVHVIHLLRRGTAVTVFHGRRPPGDAAFPVSLDRGLASVLLIGSPHAAGCSSVLPAPGGHLLAPDTATLEKRC